MKYITILGLVGICALGSSMALVLRQNSAIVAATPAPPPTLGQDLEELMHMVPLEPLHRLAARYLFNDEQFQAFIRIINSKDAYILQMRFRSQPEVMNFITWVRTQILLSGGEFQLEEPEEPLSVLNIAPFWSSNVSGWQGFISEFLLLYPQDMIRTHFQLKSAQNGIFSQLLQRLKALRAVYDRVIVSPEAQRVKLALEKNGIDPVFLDNFIREHLGWQHPPTVAPPTSTAVPAVSSTTSDVIVSKTSDVPAAASVVTSTAPAAAEVLITTVPPVVSSANPIA